MKLDPGIAALLTRNPDGLVPAVVQEASTKDVLMLAWVDDEALARMLATRRGTYWSRSRRAISSSWPNRTMFFRQRCRVSAGVPPPA